MPTAVKFMATAEKQCAAELRAKLEGQIDRIRKSVELSPAGKQRQIAKLYVETKAQLDQLRQAERERLDRVHAEQEAILYGTRGRSLDATAAISMRDAADRASRVESKKDAQALLARAERSGDQTLAAAIARESAERGWLDIVHAYADARPDASAALRVLTDLDTARAGEKRLGAAAFAITRPDEIYNANENAIAAMAANPLAEPQAATA